jgi:hypothetical protein
MPYTTIFQRDAFRFKGSGTIKAIAVIFVLLSVGVVIFTEGSKILVPGPLLIIIIIALNRKKKDEIIFYVNKNEKNDYVFAYKLKNGTAVPEITIDEYEYWCVEGGTIPSGMKYTLIFMVNSSTGTYYFKEELELRRPPANWPKSKDKIGNDKGVLLVPDLQLLARMIDTGAVSEENQQPVLS